MRMMATCRSIANLEAFKSKSLKILQQPLWRIVWRFLKKLKIELPNDPAIPHLGIYSEKTLI